MDKTSTDEIFGKLKKDITHYAELKLELLKLNTYERIGELIAVLSYSLILVFLGFFAVLFIFLALAYFIGETCGSIGLGFASVTLIYIIIMGILYRYKSRMCDGIMNLVIGALNKSDKDDEQPINNSQSNETETAHTDTNSEA
jgi:hypothetical protein